MPAAGTTRAVLHGVPSGLRKRGEQGPGRAQAQCPSPPSPGVEQAARQVTDDAEGDEQHRQRERRGTARPPVEKSTNAAWLEPSPLTVIGSSMTSRMIGMKAK